MIRFMTILLCITMFALAGCKGDKKTNATQNVPAAATDPAKNAPPPAADPAKNAPPPTADPAGRPGPPGSDKPALPATEADLDKLDIKTSEEPETKLGADVIPTAADFEEEAAEKITTFNLELELEALESELTD